MLVTAALKENPVETPVTLQHQIIDLAEAATAAAGWPLELRGREPVMPWPKNRTHFQDGEGFWTRGTGVPRRIESAAALQILSQRTVDGLAKAAPILLQLKKALAALSAEDLSAIQKSPEWSGGESGPGMHPQYIQLAQREADAEPVPELKG